MSKPKSSKSAQNLQHALSAAGLDGAQLEPGDANDVRIAHGNVWHKVSVPGATDLQNIEVQVPAQARVQLGSDGAVVSIDVDPPGAEVVEEVVTYVRGLANRGEIAGRAESGGRKARGLPSQRPTHELITSEDGTRRLIRRGFSGS